MKQQLCPSDCGANRPLPGLAAIALTFRSDHPGGVQFVLVDGSVQFLETEIDTPTLFALITRAGAEVP